MKKKILITQSKKRRSAKKPKGSSKGVGISQCNYMEVIRLTTYNLNITSDQQWPVILRFGAIAGTCERLMALCTNFQQYKVSTVQVTATPIMVNGSNPPPLYCLTSLDRELSPVVSIVLQTGHKFSNTRASSYLVKVTGRQNDTNYWFDCEKVGTTDKRPTMQWSFACDSYQSTVNTGVYQLSITAKIAFRFPQYDQPSLLKALAAKLTSVPEEKEEVKEDDKENEIEEIEKKIEELRARLADLKSQP